MVSTTKMSPPLDADAGSGGKPSDHLTVIMEQICVLNNKPARTTREVTVRPLKQSGIDLLETWLNEQTWKEVFEAQTVDEKSEILQTMLLNKIDEYLPQIKRKISSDDQPFCTERKT